MIGFYDNEALNKVMNYNRKKGIIGLNHLIHGDHNMHTQTEFMKLVEDFRICRPVLVALGDENRLHILYQMLLTEEPRGIRVGEIVKRSSLSRPAVSHHMKILKDAGVVGVRKEGTKNYYYIDPDMKSFKSLISVLERSVEYSSELPYRGEE